MLSNIFGASQKASAIAAGFLCSICLTLTLVDDVMQLVEMGAQV